MGKQLILFCIASSTTEPRHRRLLSTQYQLDQHLFSGAASRRQPSPTSICSPTSVSHWISTGMASLTNGKTLKRADPSTIHDKFLVGYQGWFTCPRDGKPVGPGHHGWLHWFNYPIPDGGRPNTDLWPDTSEYTPSELFPAPGLKYADGEQAFVFSSRHPRTVQRHFNWMALHGVDGAFLQRFLGQCDVEQGNEGIRRQRDEVGDRVREAAENEGRVFAIMYDISGVAPDRIQHVLEHDWIHLIRRRGVLDSPAYLREQGRPVVALWGFGMSDAHHSPETVRAVTRFIRDNTPGGAYIMAGVPAHWRTSVMDADPNPEFVRVYMDEFDAISPWTIGRYSDEDGADRFEEEKIKGDVEFIKAHNERWEMHKTTMRKIDYIPVIHPGGSGYNLSEGKWKWNDAPRNGGRYLWRQVYNVRRHNVRTIYGAMWDEYDEGTAFMPVVSHKRQVPVHERYRFMALDEDGFDLPPDWYMRICGFAAEGLRGERLVLDTFPSKELQDYWSSRPHYEDKAGSSHEVGGSGSGSGSAEKEGQTWEEWTKIMQSKENGDEPPPPPYSLEAGEPQIQAASSAGPPVVPLERRPSTQVQAPPSMPLSTRPAAPTLNSSSRPDKFLMAPQSPSATSHPSSPPLSPHLVPTDEFSRLAVSSSHPSSPQPDQTQFAQHHHLHSHSPSPHPSPRPISPAHSHHSHHSHTSSHSAPYHPTEPGFGPHMFPAPFVPSPPASPPGPWAQAAWPPPEWNSPQGPTAIPVIGQFLHDTSHTPPQHGPGYSPSYHPPLNSSSSPPPPSLRPRPSLSHHTRPTSPPTQAQGPSGPHDYVGGFAFPEAHIPSGSDNNYYDRPSSYSSYGSSPYNGAPQFPGETSYAAPAGPPPNAPPLTAPHASYGNASIPGGPYSPAPAEHHHQHHSQPPQHPHQQQQQQHLYSDYGSPSQSYTPPPGPPPSHPAHSSSSYGQPAGPYYGGQPSGGYGYGQPVGGSSAGGGPLGGALNMVGNVAGPGAKHSLQNLANTGSKLFNKYTRR